MSETIRISCDCQIRQGEGFVHLCPAHSDLIAAEREACAKIADDIDTSFLDDDRAACGGWGYAKTKIAEAIRAREIGATPE